MKSRILRGPWNKMSIARPRELVCAAFLTLFCVCPCVRAMPTSARLAEKVVKAWLKANPQPLETNLSQRVGGVEPFVGTEGQTVYYIVNLRPEGFVIVSADDLVEPIIAFSANGVYESSPDSPFTTLVNHDMPSRLSVVRRPRKTDDRAIEKLSQAEKALQKACARARDKWGRFSRDEKSGSGAEVSDFSAESDEITFMASSISDVRVGPLIQSKWHQMDVCGQRLYNYYTPENFPCGCMPTAMAQLIRYHEYPTVGVGTDCFTVWVESDKENLCLRGGDGNGGPYEWALMPLTPGCGTTEEQRRAIGALCYDAGVASDTGYYAGGSGTDVDDAIDALKRTFHYRSAIYGANSGNDIGPGLRTMINPNLDAGYPTLFGIITSDTRGHAVLCDGYGYDTSTLYHHINIGYGGHNDAWYTLPEIADYNFVVACVYNIFPFHLGEVISGRTVDELGNPIAGVTVTARSNNAADHEALTNEKGIYALARIRSNTSYTVDAKKKGYRFTSLSVTTRRSQDFQKSAGNVWGLDFAGVAASDADFNRDGIVNLLDFSILVEGWLE